MKKKREELKQAALAALPALTQGRIDDLNAKAKLWIPLLGSEDFQERESAQKRLEALGADLIRLPGSPLVALGTRSENPETRRRSEELLNKLSEPFAPYVVYPRDVVRNHLLQNRQLSDSLKTFWEKHEQLAAAAPEIARCRELERNLREMSPLDSGFKKVADELEQVSQKLGKLRTAFEDDKKGLEILKDGFMNFLSLHELGIQNAHDFLRLHIGRVSQQTLAKALGYEVARIGSRSLLMCHSGEIHPGRTYLIDPIQISITADSLIVDGVVQRKHVPIGPVKRPAPPSPYGSPFSD
jgi:hypothetical protein